MGASLDRNVFRHLNQIWVWGHFKLFLSSFCSVAAHNVLLGNQYHWGVLVPSVVCFVCKGVWKDGLCQLTTT